MAMRPTDQSIFFSTGSSPGSPLMFGTDMGVQVKEGDLELTNHFLEDDPTEISQAFTYPGALTSGSTIKRDSADNSLHHENFQPPTSLSNELNHSHLMPILPSESPPSSSQGSSSDSYGNRKRKSSSNSSRSALIGADVMMTEDSNMNDWKVDDLMMGGDGPGFGNFDTPRFPSMEGNLDPLGMDPDFESSNKAMETHFDFDSAASSPSPLGYESANLSQSMPQPNYNMPYRGSPKVTNAINRNGSGKRTRTAHHASRQAFSMGNSREVSPFSAMVTSQESSPSAILGNFSPSPSSTGDTGMKDPIFSVSSENPKWSSTFSPQSMSYSGLTPSPLLHKLASPFAPSTTLAGLSPPPVLTIHPTPLKSRVETQIPIKMTLFPMPPGVTKLHLPTHTISKPKLLAKPSPAKSPEILELHTMLVCTSAMQNPELLQRAFARAASNEPKDTVKKEVRRRSSADDSPSDEEDENSPLHGGEVNICPGCITRERKRAARKKVKKVEEEESWHHDEQRRVIVFNCHEVKEWASPSRENPADEVVERPPPEVPEGAMQVDAPMRIACYCRHQHEKVGFQVIFTIKDHEDKLVAQAITSSIMITDDHKTHAGPATLHSQASSISDTTHLPGAGVFASGPAYDMHPSQTGIAPFRMSHSSSDLQRLQQNDFVPQFTQGPVPFVSNHPTHATSATLTPRNLSRQASVSNPVGPIAKKRKSSGASKVPSGLAMTKIETSPQQTNMNIMSAGPSSTNPSTAPSPYTPGFPPYIPQNDAAFMSQPPSIHPQFNTGPPTPNSNEHGYFGPTNRSHSMENLPMQPIFSAPGSAHPSRPPSPGGQRGYHQAHAQIAQAVANGLIGMPIGINPHHPPTIHKLVPNEGPQNGGIEITCLGSGFCQGLEVLFGDCLATTTTYWGESSLVCLLPPSAQPGTVPVTFKHQHQQQMQQYGSAPIAKPQAFFKYYDDNEQQLLKMALSVVGHKMTGRMDDVRDIARRIVGPGPHSWGPSTSNSPTGGNQNNQGGYNAAMLGMFDVEASLLKFLDLIDLDDSPHQARLNLRRPSGQTMLHLACAMGLHRFVAALLARGANPDPRDKGGFTPMHFAALRNHPQIVRRLILNGADPTMRSLQGFMPADLATSEEVLLSTRRIQHHSRTRSGPPNNIRSRGTSAVSLKSLWDSPTCVQQAFKSGPLNDYAVTDSSGSGDTDEDGDEVNQLRDPAFWNRSRSHSRHQSRRNSNSDRRQELDIDRSHRNDVAAAGMAAWRNQFSTQLQNIQQSVHWNLPNLPQIPNLPTYQTYLPNPMVRRLSSLVPLRTSFRPNTLDDGGKEVDYKWWELFSGSAAPPAYEDIYPQAEIEARNRESKKASELRMAADTVADHKCAQMFDTASAATLTSSSKVAVATTNQEQSIDPLTLELRIGRKGSLSREQQEELRRQHAIKMKRIRSDRNLFFIWIPLLVLVMVMMLKNSLPQLYTSAQTFGHEVQRWRNGERRVWEIL